MTEQQDEARVQCMEFHITGCMFGIGAERPFPVCYHHALMHLADSTEELDGRSLDDQASQCARRVYRYTGDTGEGARAGCAAIQARARAQGVPLHRRGRARRVCRYGDARACGVYRYGDARTCGVYRYENMDFFSGSFLKLCASS